MVAGTAATGEGINPICHKMFYAMPPKPLEPRRGADSRPVRTGRQRLSRRVSLNQPGQHLRGFRRHVDADGAGGG
jgi:hypothetical protein